MYDILRDSAIGQLLRWLARRRICRYIEESASFELPAAYTQAALSSREGAFVKSPSVLHGITYGNDSQSTKNEEKKSDLDIESQLGQPANPSAGISSQSSSTISKEKTIEPRRTNDGLVLVTWYTEDDPENPHNWSLFKKTWVATVIFFYTFAVYIGSSLYTTSEEDVVQIFGVSEVAASLGLSLYIIGYGLGPLLFSPLSEIPAVGRNPPYVSTFIVFVALCVPTSLVKDFGGLLILRFLLGFFGSPCLGTAAASYGDFLNPSLMVYAIAFWAAGATLGPSLGPLIAGFAVTKEGWRWSSWELLWISGPTLIAMLFSLPETSTDTILLHRAQRLRALTGRTDLKAASEIKQSHMSPRRIAFNALIKPWEINILDPAVLFTTLYTALVYGIYYSFFESYPLVYPKFYHFNLGETGLAFLAVLVGLVVACSMYCAYLYYIADTHIVNVGPSIPPEYRLRPGLVATFLVPIGLFIFAWTARASIHWIVSIIGVTISCMGIFIVTQSMFAYLPFIYPTYAASLFAANGFSRGVFAAGAILFSRPMFLRLGVPGGVSLLAGLAAACIAGIWAIYFFGPALRKRSRFAVD